MCAGTVTRFQQCPIWPVYFIHTPICYPPTSPPTPRCRVKANPLMRMNWDFQDTDQAGSWVGGAGLLEGPEPTQSDSAVLTSRETLELSAPASPPRALCGACSRDVPTLARAALAGLQPLFLFVFPVRKQTPSGDRTPSRQSFRSTPSRHLICKYLIVELEGLRPCTKHKRDTIAMHAFLSHSFLLLLAWCAAFHPFSVRVLSFCVALLCSAFMLYLFLIHLRLSFTRHVFPICAI